MKSFKISRKMRIWISIVVLVLILIISCVFMIIYMNRSKPQYLQYNENGDINYKVSVKENEYFKDGYLEEDKQYIASLIDKIDANFVYDFNISDDVEYTYTYKIVADVNVVEDDTNKEIYSFSENLLEPVSAQSKDELKIDENIQIDYNKYNNLITDFVNTYKLKNVTSKASVKMVVEIQGDNPEFTKDTSTISMDIPVTASTVPIDTNVDLSNEEIEIESIYKNNKIFLIASILFIIIDIAILILLLIYIRKSESEEDKYKTRLKRIINNYGSYISKIEDDFDMKEYQILKVEKFIDLLEIRDTLQLPIIMIENKESLTTCFIIPTANNILYFYSLGVTQYSLPAKEDKKE